MLLFHMLIEHLFSLVLLMLFALVSTSGDLVAHLFLFLLFHIVQSQRKSIKREIGSRTNNIQRFLWCFSCYSECPDSSNTRKIETNVELEVGCNNVQRFLWCFSCFSECPDLSITRKIEMSVEWKQGMTMSRDSSGVSAVVLNVPICQSQERSK